MPLVASHQSKTQLRFRNICFTCNNYTDQDRAAILSLPYTYVVIGDEIGESGTSHLQGYMEFKNQVSFDFIKKAHFTFHFEARRGSVQDAINYCKKGEQSHDEWKKHKHLGPTFGSNAIVFEEGVPNNPGFRRDLDGLHQAATSGIHPLDFANEHPSVYYRNYRCYDKVRMMAAEREIPISQPIEVIVLYGPPGCGKSRRISEEYPDAYIVPTTENLRWWDGYDPFFHDTIVIEEFYGEPTCQQPWFLRLTDRYRVRLQTKGGFTHKNWTRVIITTNEDPESWYGANREAYLRRLTRIERLGGGFQYYPPPNL